MKILQDIFEKVLRDAPRLALEVVIRDKLKKANAKVPKGSIRKAAEHILSGSSDPFQFDDSKDDISIDITEDDLKLVTERLEKFYETELPQIIRSTAEQSAELIYADLSKRWPQEATAQVADLKGFRERLEKRYGKALGKLRMLLTIGREMVQEVYSRRPKDGKGHLSHHDDVMMRLHIRACQVLMELICLLENGFADGAMARWRTLHEIATVATLIHKHGGDMAERYVMYQIVESKKALNAYKACYRELGYEPFSAKLEKKIESDYADVIKKYGNQFADEYGWAASFLARSLKDKLKFERIETAAGMGEMRSHYKMASYNIHATPKGAYFKLGQMDDHNLPLAGASNAGLVEPAQNAAVTFAKLSILVGGAEEHWNFDGIVYGQITKWLMFEIPREFKKADDKLKRDHQQFRKSRKSS